MVVAGAASRNGAPASSGGSPRITITPSTARAPDPPTSTLPSPTFSTASRQLAALSPYSLEACLAEALEVWRRDLRSLFDHASDRFPDVGWTVPAHDPEGASAGSSSHGLGTSFSAASSAVSFANPKEETIWAHKAILYARAPNTFQARYLNLRSASEKLGHLANNSSVSLPSIRTSNDYLGSRPAWARRRTVRGSAPPSSFGMPKGYIAGSSSVASDSEDDAGVAEPPATLRRFDSRDSLASSIERPDSRSSFAGSSDGHGLGYDTASVSEGSMASGDSASTIRPPLNLEGISTEFFSSILEYLYTAEESMVEAFEFLYQDRISLGGSQEERMEKLRQDFVFMWRSKLFSDVTISLNSDGARAIRSIPDAAASAVSLASSVTHPDGAESVAGDDETSTFSTHRMILVSRSPYFASQLLSKFSDSHATTLHLPSPPFTPASVHFTLGFLYTGTLFFSNRTFDLTTAFQLWRSGDYLQVETLKSVTSALIAKQFCHEFACSPPCKSCIKRVPRTLAFTCSPDVNEPHLGGRARAAVSGEHFGAYWGKEIGNLDYTARGAIVADTCARVESNPALLVPTLRQLSIVGTKIDTERSSKWVDALRWMCESVEGRLRDLLEAQFEVIVASAEWNQLLEGVTFMRDVLDKALVMLIDGLNERRAAKIYQVLVGTVLLREDGFAVDTIRQAIEDGRGGVLRFIKRRWIGIRAFAGFNGLERWCLKEISHEIDVPEDELLLPDQEAAALAPAKKPPKVAVLRTGGRPMAARNASSSTEEREAGPINMRAQVLNRNAARATVTAASQRPAANGSRSPRTSTGPAGASASASNGAGSSTSPRVRTSSATSSNASVRRAPAPTRALSSASQSSTASTVSRSSTSVSATRSTTAAAAAARTLSANDAQRTASRTTQTSPSVRRVPSASSIRSQGSAASAASTVSGEAHTPTPSIRSVRLASSGPAPPATKVAPKASSSVGRVSGNSAAASIKSTSSAASLRAAATSPAMSGRSLSSASSTAPTTPTTPSRRSNATTPKNAAAVVRSTATTPTKTHSYLKATPKPPAGKLSTGSTSSVRSRAPSAASSNVTTPVKRTAVGTALAKTSTASTSKSTQKPVLGASTSAAANTAPVPAQAKAHIRAPEPEPEPEPEPVSASTSEMEVDDPADETVTEEDVKVAGTNLILGIPCIISPRDSQTGKSARLRATVKYIGPLKGRRGSWLGVEVPFPLPSGIEEDNLGGLNDGSDQGVRYFVLGLPNASENDGDRDMSDVENDDPLKEVELERRARRRRIAGVVRAASEALSSGGSDYHADSNGGSYDNLSPESANGQPSAKRLKNLRGAGMAMKRQLSSSEGGGETRGLFIRPHEVLFVVTPDGM